mmetsp:Transcript_32072/g.92138  ORF Transcript_32072/g.92138 Transcript_32072/m.92138 type:complete len:244 (+) Transcript_32072:451-1182(+)
MKLLSWASLSKFTGLIDLPGSPSMCISARRKSSVVASAEPPISARESSIALASTANFVGSCSQSSLGHFFLIASLYFSSYPCLAESTFWTPTTMFQNQLLLKGAALTSCCCIDAKSLSSSSLKSMFNCTLCSTALEIQTRSSREKASRPAKRSLKTLRSQASFQQLAPWQFLSQGPSAPSSEEPRYGLTAAWSLLLKPVTALPVSGQSASLKSMTPSSLWRRMVPSRIRAAKSSRRSLAACQP